MTIINTSPDRIIQLGYEGEDKVTVLRFRYPYEWRSYGEGVFRIRVRRHGEHTAYNAQLVMDDRENTTLFMTVTDVELSVKGSGEMQVVYSGADFVKKTPIYSYNVSRAVDEAVDPPAQDVYTQIIESLSDLQTDVQGLSDAVDGIGNLADLTTTAKTDLVSAINEVNSKSVDDVLSATSTNPVQNKVITEHIDSLNSTIDDLGESIEDVQTAVQDKADIQTVSALADAVNGLDSDVQGLQTTIQSKADTATVTALSGTVSGLQTAVQSKADAQTVTALSGTVTDLQTSKADKTYVDVQLDGKASTQTVSDLSDDVQDLQTAVQEKADADAVSSLIEQIYNAHPNVEAETASVVSITDGADGIPVKSLIVGIEPVQDLHGYDSPWPAGGGVNKADLTGATAYNDGTYGMYVTVDGEEITLAGTWTNSNVTGIWRFLMVPNIPSDLNVVAFENTSGNHVKDIRQDRTNNRLIITATNMVNGQAYTIKFKIVAYEGSTAPTEWTPYSNICPITGWTGAKVTVSPTTDEEDGTTYDITFPSEAGTVYGGTLDVTTGVLMVDRALVDLGTLNYSRVSGSDGVYVYTTGGMSDKALGVVNIISEALLTTSVTSWGTAKPDNSICGSATSKTVVIRYDAVTTVADLKTELSGVHAVYELATPITYQLTPQEVSTLLGQNNIWADAGDTTVEYRANTSAYIAKKIAEAISALS